MDGWVDPYKTTPNNPPNNPQQLDEARNSRRTLNEAQLRTLTLDQLLEMQQHVTNIIKARDGGLDLVGVGLFFGSGGGC